MKKNSHGYTLIEVIIVLVIISIVAMTALLSIHVNQNRRLSTLANQLANLIYLAEEEALLRPAVLALIVSAHEFSFLIYDNDNHQWHAFNQKPLNTQTLLEDIQLTLKIHDKVISDNSTPQLIFSSGGDITPFILYIGKKDEPPRYQITGEENGHIQIDAAKTE